MNPGASRDRDVQLILVACAHAAHEANRAYCIAIGDMSQPAWDSAPSWQVDSALVGVRGVLIEKNTPEESHESWVDKKISDGWIYGPVKDPDHKEHPCLVAYDKLPAEQKRKDEIFVEVVWAVALALGWNENAVGASRSANSVAVGSRCPECNGELMGLAECHNQTCSYVQFHGTKK